MSKISALADYLQETAIQKLAIGEASPLIPAEDRIYLTPEGLIPNINKKPMDLKPPIVPQFGKRKGVFIDKRQLLRFHKNDFEEAQAPDKDNLSYGGIFINKDGLILMRKPKGEFGGQRWTFAKGGANEGESPSHAALREVEEETGIKGKIISEIPGHYNSTNSSNKYFLMEADIDDDHIKSFKSDETDKLKWMTSAEAMQALSTNENESSSKRDKEVLSSALQITRENSKQTSLNEHFNNYESNKKQSLQENLEAVADYFVNNEQLPNNLKNNPQTAMMIHHVAKALVSPSDTVALGVSEFFPILFKKLDEHYELTKENGFESVHLTVLKQWGNNASDSDDTVNLIQEIMGAKYNIPHSYAYGKKIPEDTDVLGKSTYRNDEQRDEIIDLYSKWKTKEIEPSGTFSWGESYNFNTKEKVDYSHRTQEGEFVTKQANPYKLMFERANSVKEARIGSPESQGVIAENETYRTDIRRKYGESYIKGVLEGNLDDYNDDDIQNYGNKFLATYVDHMQTMNKQILDAIYPDTDHLIMWRKASNIDEIVGRHGLKGTTRILPHKFGMPDSTEVKESDEGFRVRVHSTPVAGGSINPSVWSGTYALASKVNKNDFLVLHPFMYPNGGNTHAGEKETIYVVNTPETDARVINTSSNQYSASSESGGWADFGNGFAPLNLFGTYKDKGVTAPNTDYYYSLRLQPATSEDSPFISPSNKGQLGSNSGGLKKDSKGNLFYVKHENSERNKSEVFATNIYKEAGINVPDVELINYNGTLATKSKWLDNPITHTAFSNSPPEQLLNSPDVKDGFFVDALLANYDVAGASYDNFVESNGKIYRVDSGGTFQHRAMSKELKPNYQNWSGKYIDELSSMMDTQYNSGKIFSTMTDDDIKRAANNLFKLTNSKIEGITEDSGFSDFDGATLKKRRDSIINWLVDNKGDIINHSSVKSVNDEYNILKSEILKEDSAQKEISDIFIGNNSGRHTEKTPEQQKEINKHNERMSELYEKEWERVFADDDQ
tara:strand:- start:9196 stop:12225 length:3030 start_codon:yes stop_codon:yes gene_type:complete